MFALFFWKVTLPVVHRLKYPFTFSLVVGCLALYTDAGIGSQQVFAYFPFFVGGYLLQQRGLPSRNTNIFSSGREEASFSLTSLWASKKVQATGVLLLFAFLGLSCAVDTQTFEDYFENPIQGAYSCLSGSPIGLRGEDPDAYPVFAKCSANVSIPIRLVFYVGSFIAVISFMSLMPRRVIPVWTMVGQMSFNVYVWHGPVLVFLIPVLGPLVTGELLCKMSFIDHLDDSYAPI